MSARATPLRSTADWRWLVVVTGITLVQAVLIVWVSDRTPAPPDRPGPMARVRLVDWNLTPVLSDPTLLALPGASGFAGIGWRRAADPSYVTESWYEPMPWLNQSETGLARLFLAAPVSGVGRGLTAEKPAPQLTENLLAPLPLPERTRVRILASGTDWESWTPLAAPAIAHSNVLTETILGLTAAPSGQVFSAVVLKSSGLKAADQQALALARNARFRITGFEGVTEWAWARLVFDWRTLAPGETEERAPRGS